MSAVTTAPASVANGDGGYLTSEEVARKLRRSPKTIRRFVATGMPAYKVRGRLFFDPAEVDAWLRDRGDQAKRPTAQPTAAASPASTGPPSRRVCIPAAAPCW